MYESVPTEDLDDATRAAIVDVCIDAHDLEDFRNLFTHISSGGRHVLAFDGSALVGHAVVTTRWLQLAGLPVLKTAYVNAVSTGPTHQGKGAGSGVMRRLAADADVDHDIAAWTPTVDPSAEATTRLQPAAARRGRTRPARRRPGRQHRRDPPRPSPPPTPHATPATARTPHHDAPPPARHAATDDRPTAPTAARSGPRRPAQRRGRRRWRRTRRATNAPAATPATSSASPPRSHDAGSAEVNVVTNPWIRGANMSLFYRTYIRLSRYESTDLGVPVTTREAGWARVQVSLRPHPRGCRVPAVTATPKWTPSRRAYPPDRRPAARRCAHGGWVRRDLVDRRSVRRRCGSTPGTESLRRGGAPCGGSSRPNRSSLTGVAR